MNWRALINLDVAAKLYVYVSYVVADVRHLLI